MNIYTPRIIYRKYFSRWANSQTNAKKENPTDQKSAQENKLSANYENIEMVVCVFDTFENDNLEKR